MIYLTVKSIYKNENGKKFIIGFITEITEIKKAQEKIKQLHANLEAVMESANESIFAVDQNLNYTAFNKHHQKDNEGAVRCRYKNRGE